MLQDRVKTFYSKCSCFQMELIFYSLYMDLNCICILLLPPFLSLLLSSAFELECILHPNRELTQLLYFYMVKCKVEPESSTSVSCFTSQLSGRLDGMVFLIELLIISAKIAVSHQKNPRKQLTSLCWEKKLEKPFIFKYPNWLPSVTLNLI